MTALLTYCTCVDPRRINPATGHYPGCPDEIIPPECLLPPWEVISREERVYASKGPRSERHPDGKPIFDTVTTTELVPGRAWTAPRAAAPMAPVEQHAAVEAPRGAEKPVESAAVPAAVPPVPAPAPSPSPKTVKGRRTVPTGPSLFDRLQEQGPSVAEKMHERKTAS